MELLPRPLLLIQPLRHFEVNSLSWEAFKWTAVLLSSWTPCLSVHLISLGPVSSGTWSSHTHTHWSTLHPPDCSCAARHSSVRHSWSFLFSVLHRLPCHAFHSNLMADALGCSCSPGCSHSKTPCYFLCLRLLNMYTICNTCACKAYVTGEELESCRCIHWAYITPSTILGSYLSCQTHVLLLLLYTCQIHPPPRSIHLWANSSWFCMTEAHVLISLPSPLMFFQLSELTWKVFEPHGYPTSEKHEEHLGCTMSECDITSNE